MPKGISIHIGVRAPWDGCCRVDTLNGPENDAAALADLAKSRDFRGNVLLVGAAATVDRVEQEMTAAAREMQAGDILLLTFSGHGCRIFETTEPRDELDLRDETWCLADGEMIDDRLREIWERFAAGVRIVVVSDSCKSGSIKMRLRDGTLRPLTPAELKMPVTKRSSRTRSTLGIAGADAYGAAAHPESFTPESPGQIKANVLILAACGETENSEDGWPNSLFTRILLEVWKEGTFNASYKTLMAEVRERVLKENGEQTPQTETDGTKDPALLNEPPFTI